MNRIAIVVLTLLTAAACNIKSATTTNETVTAFKNVSSGRWVSECTRKLDIDGLGSSSRIAVGLNENNSAVISLMTYTGTENCAGLSNSPANVSTDNYDFTYQVNETVTADFAKLTFISVKKAPADPQTTLHVQMKSAQGKDDSLSAEVRLTEGSIVIGGALRSIPQKLLRDAKLRFTKSAF